ncbi:MAG: flagellar biosynthesis protein FlhA [Pseudomonadota bacterium]
MKLLSLFRGRQDLALVGMLMLIILVMIIPLPTLLIDALIVLNISLTVMILIVAVYLKRPDDFSAFPAIILIATTFRLAVSVSTTRMILSQADAGQIVETFGTFATQGSIIVGMVIFLIITTVQFIVITKGSERVAEVAARFTLDALPGRQMSIDSELRAGDITPEQASARRKSLEKENQFFGAMDGAMKFVKGDAIAGLVIIAINLLGGISIGVLNSGLSAAEAGQVYSLLTIGDGLVSQLPALIMAICAGTIITRVTTDKHNDLGTDITEQLVGQSKSLFIGAFLIAFLGFIPGFPTEIFLAMSLLLIVGGYFLRKREQSEQENDKKEYDRITKGLPVNDEDADQSITVQQDDVFKIAVGNEIYQKFDRELFIVQRERSLRRGYQRTGINLPRFGVSLDEMIDPATMIVSLDDVPVFSATIPDGVKVVICDPDILEINELPIVPVESHWPLKSAYWIEEAHGRLLAELDVEVIEMGELLARLGGHYMVAKSSKILGYKAVQEIIRDLAKEHDQLATQVTQVLSPVQLLNVLRNLLDDGVPLIPRRILFEALLEGTLSGGSANQLAEQARFALARQVCANYADDNRLIAGYVLEPQVETAIKNCTNLTQEDAIFIPDAELSDVLLRDVAERRHIEEINAKPPVIITQAEIRRPLAQYLKEHNLASHVMAFRELSGEFSFNPIGTIGASYTGDADGYYEQNYVDAAE